MRRPAFLLATLGLAAAATSGVAAPPELGASRRTSLDADWRFFRGEAAGAEKLDFADGSWRRLDLPHDWAIEGPFDRKYGPHRGALPFFGVGWYRKHFTLPASARGRTVSVEFDGAMAHARVWLNGEALGGRPYGYIGFSFDLTPHLRLGEDNVLAVRLAPKDHSSRWYPGAGIYRHVWLDVMGPVHVARWGTYVTTPRVSDAEATVVVRTEVRNRGSSEAVVAVETSLVDATGAIVARATRAARVPAEGSATVAPELTVTRPERWDVGRPYLYQAVSVIRDHERAVDRTSTSFGIRSILFDRTRGFVLNGRRVPLQGVCLHHDLGALGTAVDGRAIERQLEILQGMGANAIRTSHNPPAPELLGAADRLGFVVMDEAFDEWRKTKVANGNGTFFDEWGERDLRDMIRRDRNHPSVVLWSIGNEVLEQADPDGWKLARRLTAICHEEDPTRPVTAGFNQLDNAIRNGLVAEVDVAGFNYQAPRYGEVLRKHPDWIVLGAETSSCVSSRGVYHLPIEKYQKHPSRQITSYDVIAPPWAYAPDVEWAALDRFPRVLGEFVWTGFDYLGEPTPYFMWNQPRDDDWPSRSSYFGIVDLAGFPKDRYYLYQSRWTDEPMVHLLPHWNWEGREGREIPVFAYTNAEEVELFLNGRSLGRKRKGTDLVTIPVGEKGGSHGTLRTPYRLAWSVPWEPGVLRAVAFREGAQVATTEVRTAGEPARVVLSPDRVRLAADGEDLSFVTVRIEDVAGALCPRADNLVRFEVTGAGRIAGVDNGDPTSLASFQAPERRAFGGLALLIVRTERDREGAIRIVATSDGLQSAGVSLEATRE
jgi:beta-galactosidase